MCWIWGGQNDKAALLGGYGKKWQGKSMGRKHTAINWECVALFLYMLGQMRSLGWPLI
jgi:hypothetical protein